MSLPTAPVTPEAVLVAGSLIDVPVSIDQALAVSARIEATPDLADAPGRRHSWRIPAVEAWVTGASPVTGQLEVHFDQPDSRCQDAGATTSARHIVVYDTDGTVLSAQAWAA